MRALCEVRLHLLHLLLCCCGVLQAALTMQAQQGVKARCHVVAYCDSQRVVQQLQGEYKAKGNSLLQLHKGATDLTAQFASFEIQHVHR